MIVVFPYLYTSKTQETCSGLDPENCRNYDNFINDLTTDLMPYIESTFSVKTGRENTAITGFSMGGREALFIGITHADLFYYIGAACPAPGLTPTTDSNMAHPGQLKESELIIEETTPCFLLLTDMMKIASVRICIIISGQFLRGADREKREADAGELKKPCLDKRGFPYHNRIMF